MKTRIEQMAMLELTLGSRDLAIALVRKLASTGHLMLIVCSDDDRPAVRALLEDVELLGGDEPAVPA